MNPSRPLAVWSLALLASTSLAISPDDYGAPAAGKVKIVRDSYGVPHIIARDNYSLFFGVGYCQAEDQLENMAMNFLRGQGRAAEREGQASLQIDVLIRALQVPQRAAQIYATLSPETRQQLEGFAAGANHYRQQHAGTVAEWVEPVRPQDVIAFAMFVDTMFSFRDCRSDLEAAGIKLAMSWPLPTAARDLGSNQFAVSPQRSGSGACLLSMDPHLPLNSFFRWYEMHLVGPEINAMGACFCGSPYVSMGRTLQTAWCMTVNDPDLGDVFAFQLHPEDRTQYKGLNGWQKFEMSMETFKVGTEKGMVDRSFPMLQTDVGPVVTVQNGTAYVFALPQDENVGRADQLYAMMRAQNATEFRQALRPLGLVMFNILYADKHGDLFYISNGRIPKRDTRIASTAVRPGDQAWARWQGFHPQEDLPQLLNPPAGYVVNTNSGPHNATPTAAPDPANFPDYMIGHQANSRFRRLNQLLHDDQQIDFDEMQIYATDTKVEVDEVFLQSIIDAATSGAAEPAELLKQTAELLRQWDQRTDLDSQGAVLFYYLAADAGIAKAVDSKDTGALAARIAEVAGTVQSRFGALDVPWEQFSRIRRGDQELGIAGSGSIDREAGAALRPTGGPVQDGRRYANGGSSYGMIVDFAGQTRSISCLPFGVSENPDSPYFANQLPLYVKREFKPAWFLPGELQENTASDQVLEPAGAK